MAGSFEGADSDYLVKGVEMARKVKKVKVYDAN
jgi:hypothetical protein